jgi:hypothetical protein
MLGSLDVSSNTELTELHCNLSNEYPSASHILDVTKNPKLEVLHCAGNQLTSLDLSENKLLKELVIGTVTTLGDSLGNNLTSLDLSNNTELRTQDCSWDKLTSLDVSKNVSLTRLTCRNNNLTSLELSENIALETLECDGNLFSSLDISSNIALGTDMDGNIDLSLDSMSTLYEVCVWTIPFPPDGLQISTLGSPNVYFRDCVSPELFDTDSLLYQPEFIHASSTEDGMIYCVLEGTGKDLASIRERCSDSIDVNANNDVQVDISALQNGSYLLYAVDVSGNISDPKSFTIMGVGVPAQIGIEFLIYPNPVDDILSIQFGASCRHSIHITSVSGQLIYSTEVTSYIHQFDMSAYPSGIYLLNIRSDELLATKKIIKL